VSERHAGLLLPLFAFPSSASWGVGELPDVVPLAAWMADAGLDRLLVLPIGTMPDGEASPYSAESSMAIDPLYVAVTDLEDFHYAGGLAALAPDRRRDLEAAVRAPRVRHAAVRRAKTAALDLAFSHFERQDWAARSDRAAELETYVAREAWWLADYALFRAISSEAPHLSWRDWPEPIRDRHPAALAEARRVLDRRIRREQYEQWAAETQWQASRRAAAARGVTIVGDLPFVAARDSADVWARAGEYLLDVSVGAPPDAFSETGQDWQLPGYHWDAVAAAGDELMRRRARRMAALFDSIRIDHLVGLYRTYCRPPGGAPFFVPGDERAQLAQGERVLGVFRDGGAELLAEDLGTVPDFVRASMARLGVPGTRVLRWERRWEQPGRPFIDPASFPTASIAMTGTHDTETLAGWWDHADEAERAGVLQLPAMRTAGVGPREPWSDRLRDALLEMAWRSGSRELFVPAQDLFGWRDRINTPGTITGANWTWKLPMPVDELTRDPVTVARAVVLRKLSRSTTRAARVSS